MKSLTGLRVLAGAVLTGLILSGNVQAAPENSAAEELWLLAKYDGNGDRVITVDEISEKRKQIFERMDGDADGGVSFDEYLQVDAAKRQMLLKARFSKLDLNQDGILSDEEYCSYLGSFERFDQDGDGNITTQEISQEPREPLESAAVAQENADDTHCLFWVCIRTRLD